MTELQGQKASENLLLKSRSSQTVVRESGLVRKTRDQSGKGREQERRMVERNGDVPGALGSTSGSFTQEIFAKMHSFVRL